MRKRIGAGLAVIALSLLLPAGVAYADQADATVQSGTTDDLEVRPIGWKGRESAITVNDPSLTVEDKVTLP